MICRRTFLLASAAIAVSTSRLAAQSYPPAQVRILVPFPPGGATDVLARVVTTDLQKLWGQTVIQDYRSGAAGLIGSRQIAGAPPDGANLLLASTGAILTLAASHGTETYDIATELAPISLVAAPPYLIVANPSLPVKTAAELIAYAKANPGTLAYGSSGVGSASHLAGALFSHMADIDILHVPYRGTGPAMTDLLGGRVQLMFSPAPTAAPHIEAGTLRVIGTTGDKRSALFPDYPTAGESGLPGYASIGWFGLFAPAKTPQAILDKVSADVATILSTEDAKKRMAQEGAEPAPNSPAEFTKFVNAEIAKWLDLAKKTGIKLVP